MRRDRLDPAELRRADPGRDAAPVPAAGGTGAAHHGDQVPRRVHLCRPSASGGLAGGGLRLQLPRRRRLGAVVPPLHAQPRRAAAARRRDAAVRLAADDRRRRYRGAGALCRHPAEGIYPEELLAPAWAFYMEEYLRQRAAGVPFLAIRYDELDADREATPPRLLRHCGLPAEAVPAVMRAFGRDFAGGHRHRARPARRLVHRGRRGAVPRDPGAASARSARPTCGCRTSMPGAAGVRRRRLRGRRRKRVSARRPARSWPGDGAVAVERQAHVAEQVGRQRGEALGLAAGPVALRSSGAWDRVNQFCIVFVLLDGPRRRRRRHRRLALGTLGPLGLPSAGARPGCRNRRSRTVGVDAAGCGRAAVLRTGLRRLCGAPGACRRAAGT